MHIVFPVEELSAEAALLNHVPKILDSGIVSFEIHPYQCKADLLSKSPTVAQMEEAYQGDFY